MHTFNDKIIEKTVDRLIRGEDYRNEVILSINSAFFEYCLDFFKKIIEAKMNNQTISLEWYKSNFINDANVPLEDILTYAGMNKKTIENVYSSAKKDICLKVCKENIDNLEQLLKNIDDGDINITISLDYNNVSVKLNLTESLIIINALATKKISIRGGAWSSIGKKVEKPLLDKLCDLVNVPKSNRDNKHFVKDKKKKVDREVDYKLISNSGKIYRIEVKLMGKGNPESADATIARDSHIFIADTLSEQNRNQLKQRKIEYLELKNNGNILKDFQNILKKLAIPYHSK